MTTRELFIPLSVGPETIYTINFETSGTCTSQLAALHINPYHTAHRSQSACPTRLPSSQSSPLKPRRTRICSLYPIGAVHGQLPAANWGADRTSQNGHPAGRDPPRGSRQNTYIGKPRAYEAICGTGRVSHLGRNRRVHASDTGDLVGAARGCSPRDARIRLIDVWTARQASWSEAHRDGRCRHSPFPGSRNLRARRRRKTQSASMDPLQKYTTDRHSAESSSTSRARSSRWQLGRWTRPWSISL